MENKEKELLGQLAKTHFDIGVLENYISMYEASIIHSKNRIAEIKRYRQEILRELNKVQGLE